MIETSLIKLSLIRARSQQALYDYRPTIDPRSQRNMAKALDAAHRKLRKDEQRLKEEEFQVDQQLQEYEGVLKIVDVSSGGYRQLIDDWVRVKRESEECRRDLRRLGWTGPD
jgi:triphosphoribosyl-dephospho-CoA synthetase